MAGRNKFAKLRDAMTPAQKAAVEAKVAALRAEMTLANLDQECSVRPPSTAE